MSGSATAEIPAWVFEWTDHDLRAWFGDPTFERGRAYAREGAVRIVPTGAASNMVLAQVAGNSPSPYQTRVSRPSSARRQITSRCSCPIAVDCKHAVAVMLAAREQYGDQSGDQRSARQASGPAWAGLLDDLVAPTASEQPAPMALQLEIVQPRNAPGLRVRLRPMAQGKSGWIKTGASWGGLEHHYYGYRAATPSRAQQAWAREVLAIVRSRLPSYYSSYTEPVVYLDELGPAAWRLMAEARRAGYTLIGAHGGEVEVEETPARVAVDLRRSAEGDVTMTTALHHPAGWDVPSHALLIGDPAHGAVISTADLLRLVPLDPPVEPATQRLLGASPVVIPQPEVARFLAEYYPTLSRRLSITSSDASVSLPTIEPPRLSVQVTFQPDHVATVDASFRYRVGDQSRDVPLDGGAHDAGRDLTAENDLVARLDVLDLVPGLRLRTPQGYRLVASATVRRLDTADLVERVLPALAADDAVELSVVGEPAPYGEADTAPLVSVAMRDDEADPDWFDLDVTVSVDGETVPFTPLFTAMSLGEDRLLLDSGTWFRLDRPELQRLRGLIEEARALEDRPGRGLRLTPVQAGLWEELVSLGVVTEQSERWSRSAGALLSLTELPRPDPPHKLQAELRPYQVDGYHWLSLLWDLQLGGILADDMGLGKTVQTLAMAARAKEAGTLGAGAGPLLIVTPTSVMSTWAEQAKAFCPDLDVRVVAETERRSGSTVGSQADGADLVITSFTLFRIDEEAYRSVRWCGLVLDEAQFVKNHQAKTYQCARRLPTPFKLAITGTPMENSLMDLWSMLSIVAPGLFPNPQRFSEFFRRPIENGTAPERLDALRRRVRPLMLRRTKELVAADLPPKTEQVLDVPLNPQHRRVYDTHLNRERQRVLRLVTDLDKNRITILQSLTMLRQLSLDAALIDETYAGKVRSSKIDVLVEHLREVAAEGHRALVFSQFARFLGSVRTRLGEEGIGCCYLDGRTRDRDRRIAEFTEGDDPVFLISLKAGGFGLNLTAADYVYVLDPWWNPAAEEQAIDRAHRIGQDKPVMVYRLVATDTIEQKVLALQQRKRDLFAQVVDGGAASSGALTADDIRELFAAG
ncbi:MAG TPA: DEAD/DEAH box helicase [Mycobacteriales bacterium]|nr:DEAD/DEAH box helicase [Mycobacteriales bacterium]